MYDEIRIEREHSSQDVYFNGKKIGMIVPAGQRNTRNALDLHGNVIAANCYANGGADIAAAFHLAVNLGLLSKGGSHVLIDADGKQVGPYTFSGRTLITDSHT